MEKEPDFVGEWCFSTEKGGTFVLASNPDGSVAFLAKHKQPQHLRLQNDGSWSTQNIRIRFDGKDDLVIQQLKGKEWGPEVKAYRSSSPTGYMRQLTWSLGQRSLSERFEGLSRVGSFSDSTKPEESKPLAAPSSNGPPAKMPSTVNGVAASANSWVSSIASAFPRTSSATAPTLSSAPTASPVAAPVGPPASAPAALQGGQARASSPGAITPYGMPLHQGTYVKAGASSSSTQRWRSTSPGSRSPSPGPRSLRRPLLKQKGHEQVKASVSARVEDLALACVVAGSHGTLDTEGLELIRGLWERLRRETSLVDVSASLNNLYQEKRRCFVERQLWPIRFLAQCLCWDMSVDAEDLRYVMDDWVPSGFASVCASLGWSRLSGSKTPLAIDDKNSAAAKSSRERPKSATCGSILGFFMVPPARHGSACMQAFCEEFTHRFRSHQEAETCSGKLLSWSCRQMSVVLALYMVTLFALFAPVVAQVYSLVILHGAVTHIWKRGVWILLDAIKLVACMWLAGFLSEYQVVILPRVAMCQAKLRVGANVKPSPASSGKTEQLGQSNMIVDDV